MQAAAKIPFQIKSNLSIAIKSVLLGTVLSGMGHTVLAAEIKSTIEKTQQIQIHGGSLDQALALFAGQTGSELSYDPALVKGKKTQGLNGKYTFEQGITQLLKGTGLTLIKRQDGTWGIIDSNNQLREVGQLPSINSTASNSIKNNHQVAQLPVIQLSSEDKSSYAAKKVSIGKTEQSIKEIPQSVSVITQQQIKDQGFTTIAETLNQATGVTAYGYSGSENYQIRFAAANIQINGVPQADNISNEDPALYETIEVLRGPSGLLTGSGDPSGSINFIRKRPTLEPYGSFAISGGSWGSHREEFDVSNKLNESGSLRGRLIAVQNTTGKFRDAEKDDDKATIYAAFDYDLTDRATFGVSGTYINENYINFWGLPLDHNGHVPSRKSFVGYNVPSKRDQKQFSADFKYQFDDGWVAKAAYNHNEVDHKNFGMYSYAPLDENGLTTAGVGHIQQTFTNTSFDINLSGPFHFLNREHQLLLGYNQWENDSLSGFKYVAVPNWDVLHNHDFGAYVNTNISDKNRTVTKQSGFYTAAKIKLLDPLTLTLGGRWTDYTNQSQALKANNEFTPYAGLIWDINPEWSWYASYADSFVPQSELDYTGKILDPRVGWQIETGLKAELFDGAVNATTAIFQIRDKNRATLDQDHIGCNTDTGECYRAAGEVQARGFEFEITGKVTPHLNITTGYTYNDIKYLSDTDPENVGQRYSPDTIPKQLFKLWSLYKFDQQQFSGVFDGLDMGLGMQAQSGLYNSSLKQSGFSIVSARVGYQIDSHWQASLQINNLFDKTYFNYPGNSIFYNIYGAPRNFMLTLSAKY
ncbi:MULTISPECIES: TonB-dependent siderophore receptor [unclassified Acinetobacter]|uniref:TonB-dependent siderophore receptor n=1 Tax=unclassified Acinetobacter TaxID=196816 RepID=UPI00190A6352|nr:MULTISPECIES: TonB-dependent receptor [unclassified Acinetobacter]MBK0062753.1 TonB-dependent siderophore receptor [Acinetobacter sp. S55]MBK0065670.1 TonB-dependent siderophore receptor [Acinetobacter sp. S54]